MIYKTHPDSRNEPVIYNLSALHQPRASTLLRIAVEAVTCGMASIGFGWVIMKEKKIARAIAKPVRSTKPSLA
ncbi:MAG: hypothetical protein KGH89_09570 [Thaumarchaeota archaeon]|nr:hypothetical protein [Nitrososphaerota archaeon]